MSTKKIKNLVFSGGELRGLAYIGIQKALEEIGILGNIENILGVSVGSIFALTICLGYTSSQIEKIVLSLEIDRLKDIEADGIFRIFTKFGLDSAKQFEKLYKILIRKKLDNEDATFSDLRQKFPDKNLLVWGSNLNLDRGEYFSYETTPNMRLWEAIRISTCFPIYFEAYRYNGYLYADGGISNNYPIDYFHNSIEETLGIVLKHDDKNSREEIDNFEKYIISLLKCITQSTQNIMETQYKKYTVTLDIPYSFLNLDISDIAKKANIEAGYTQFIDKFNKLYQRKEVYPVDIIDNGECVNEVISDIQSVISYRSNSIDIENTIDNVL